MSSLVLGAGAGSWCWESVCRETGAAVKTASPGAFQKFAKTEKENNRRVSDCECFVLKQGLYSPGWPETPCVAKDNLELLMLLPLPLECWDYRWVTLLLNYAALKIEAKVLSVQTKHHTN